MEPSNPERLSVRIYFEFGADSGAPKEQRREATALFKHYRQVILPTKDRSVRQVATFMQLFGVSFTARILAVAKWMKRKRERRIP